MKDNNNIHNLSTQQSQVTLLYRIRTSFTNVYKHVRSKSTAFHAVCSCLCYYQNNSNRRAITNFTLPYTSRFTNIPWCNDRPITVYPSNRNVCLTLHTVNCVGNVKQEQCAICCPDTVANVSIQTDKQYNIYMV
jgi:hypothetical protein